MEIRPNVEAPNDEKLKELMLYVAQKCEDDARFGATKLNKILFYSDFLSYLETGRSITGQTYQRLPNGPAPRRLLPVRGDLLDTNEAVLQRRRVMNYTRHRLIALRDPKLEIFTGSEIEVVNRVLRGLRDKNADEVSRLSHKFIGWKLADDGEDIPYPTVFVSNRRLNQAEIEIGRKLEASLGL